MKQRVALLVQYKGSNYSGWQIQDNANTVEEELEKALSKLCQEKIKLTGCSRTDAGVHALAHVSHFDTSFKMPYVRMSLALKPLLPDDIAVLKSRAVSQDFNARFSTKGKQYSYYIYNSSKENVFIKPYVYEESRDLDLEAMQKACTYFIGEHDFRTFMATGSSAKTTVRTIYDLNIDYVRPGLLRLKIKGNAFLYNMVRIIAGTILYVGLGKIQLEDIPKIIASKDRTKAGKTLAAKGLFLDKVFYDDNPFAECYNSDK